jgi:hypothetical protein
MSIITSSSQTAWHSVIASASGVEFKKEFEARQGVSFLGKRRRALSKIYLKCIDCLFAEQKIKASTARLKNWEIKPLYLDVPHTRVARWYIFKPKIPIWVNFGGSCNGRCLHIIWPFGIPILWPFGIPILWPFGIFYGHLVYFMAIWSILWSFGLFYGHLDYLVYLSRFGMLNQEKSGNPAAHDHTQKITTLKGYTILAAFQTVLFCYVPNVPEITNNRLLYFEAGGPDEFVKKSTKM